LATLNSLSQPTIFQSDVTYYVAGPVYCNGPVTLEAACFKFPYYSGGDITGRPATPAYISINNGITCKTAEYFPAIFTSADDDTEGDSLYNYPDYPQYAGTVNGFYGSPCLLIKCQNASLSNLRFRYAQEAIRFEGTSAGGGTPYT